ncbi:hypothetical protein H5410_035535 [Solanum commersonii]|uniref:Reverse transcriptase n=1 Tax=Solanum commersonii TaxID=4109 RepID=A0A9J5Y357_SOLCO|nr:hypothetical protein H5410_035535 [Solanum commersonii]
MVPLYKNKGDIQNCNNYRGIKLLSHTMKIWERVVEMRVRKGVSISENQFGFMPGLILIDERGIELMRGWSDGLDETDVEVRLAAQVIPKKESFRYLGAVIQGSGDIDDDVTHRVGAAWMKWRLASGVLCDKKISPKLKERIRVHKMHVAEMRMLRWMCGHTRSDKIRNEVIREKVGVASVVDKARTEMVWTCEEAGLERPVRRCEVMVVEYAG